MDFDIAIIGAGAIGLACAASLARKGLSVLVLERHRGIVEETSSRNSGVIHAGLYYPTGSLKARLCVEGRRRLYDRCARLGLPHARVGKLLVATDETELRKVEAIQRQGLENEAGELRLLDAAELRELEPHVRGIAALLSPETGIVDAHALARSYRSEAEEHGAVIAFGHTVHALESTHGSWRVEAQSVAGERASLAARWVVNAAGLEATRIAALAGIDVDAHGYRQYLCKGDYFRLAGRYGRLARHLVYPVPVEAGLGIHLTMDLAGTMRFGPDTEYIDGVHYDVDAGKAARFGAAIRRYLPEVRDEDLTPDYAGIRPKLQPPGGAVRDFVIEASAGLVNLVGIESPGLTASEAIGARVAALIEGGGVLV